MWNPISFHAEMMGNIMHLYQALKQSDDPEFVEAVAKEVNVHIDRKHWEIVLFNTVPKNIEVLPSVWAMCCKRNLMTNKVTKHNVRVNLPGGKQTYRINYFETYAPVVTWFMSMILYAHLTSTLFYECEQFNFNYRSIIGKLNHLAQTMRPDIIFAVHQLTIFLSDLRKEHGISVLYLCMYLNKTHTGSLKFPTWTEVLNAMLMQTSLGIKSDTPSHILAGTYFMLHVPLSGHLSYRDWLF